MKKFISFLVLCTFALSLSSCIIGGGGGGGKDNAIPEELSSDPIQISFWHAMGTDKQAIIQAIIDDFNVVYPNVTVEQVSLGDYTTLRDTITSGIAADELPTIAQTYPDHVAVYNHGEATRELDSYVDHVKWGISEAELNQFVPGFLAEGRIYDSKGTLYSLPFNKSSEVLVYNKTVFDKYGWKVPSTWQDCLDVAKKYVETTEYLTQKNAGKKVSALGYDSEANMFITMTQQWGGQYTGFDENGKGVYLFQNQQTKDALTFYKNAFDAGYFATTTYFGTKYCSDAFKSGQMLMTISSSAGVSYNMPADGNFEVGVTTYPQNANSEKEYVIQQGTNVSLFKRSNAQEELAGFLFLKFLTSYESALKWSSGTSYFPIRKDVLASEEYQDYIAGKIVAEDGTIKYEPTAVNKAAEIGLSQQNWFYTNAAFLGTSKCRDEAALTIQAILYGGKTIDAAIQESMDRLIYS